MTNNELKQHVQRALDWEPIVDDKDVGIAVDDGVVTLRGTVRSYAENAMRKLEARNRVHAVAIAVRMGILD